MMISPALCPTLTLLLIIVSVFTISLTENLQLADGFSSIASHLEYDIQVGETQLHTWGIINDDTENPLYLEMYATGPGAELFVFEEDIVIEPGAIKYIEIFVLVPEDHPDNLIYYPQVFALKIKEHTTDPTAGSSAKININIQHVTKPIIRIGDNPIEFRAEVIEQETQTETETKPTAQPEEETKIIPGETMAEKLARVQAANLAKQSDQKVDDIFEEAFEEEAVPDYEPEPIADYEKAQQEVKALAGEQKECGFIDWILSLFGFGKC